MKIIYLTSLSSAKEKVLDRNVAFWLASDEAMQVHQNQLSTNMFVTKVA
jgi:hypothetical protein